MITSITINSDNTPTIKRYNGSWHVIDHTSSDGKDYSITIWEYFYESLEMLDESDEPSDELIQEAWDITLEMLEDNGIKLIK